MKKPVNTSDLKKTYCSLNNKIKNIQNKISELNTNNTSEETKKQLEELNTQVNILQKELKSIENNNINITEQHLENNSNPILKSLRVDHDEKSIYQSYTIDAHYVDVAIRRIFRHIENIYENLKNNNDNVIDIYIYNWNYNKPIDLYEYISDTSWAQFEIVRQEIVSNTGYAIYNNHYIVPNYFRIDYREIIIPGCDFKKINWYIHHNNTVYNPINSDRIYIKNKTNNKEYLCTIHYEEYTIPSTLLDLDNNAKHIMSGDIITDETWSLYKIGTAVSYINEQVKFYEPIDFNTLLDDAINLYNIDRMFSNRLDITEILTYNIPNHIASMEHTFSDCINLTKIHDDFIDTSCGNLKDISYCFSGCINLEGESPSVTVNGKKYKLWELNRDNGYPVNLNGEECFRGCTKLTDYDQIPDSWK